MKAGWKRRHTFGLFFMLKESTPFRSAWKLPKLSYNTKNAAYAAERRTARKRNMVAGATALRRECAQKRTLFHGMMAKEMMCHKPIHWTAETILYYELDETFGENKSTKIYL